MAQSWLAASWRQTASDLRSPRPKKVHGSCWHSDVRRTLGCASQDDDLCGRLEGAQMKSTLGCFVPPPLFLLAPVRPAFLHSCMRSGARPAVPWVAGALRLPRSFVFGVATRTTGVRTQPHPTLHGRSRVGFVVHTLQKTEPAPSGIVVSLCLRPPFGRRVREGHSRRRSVRADICPPLLPAFPSLPPSSSSCRCMGTVARLF